MVGQYLGLLLRFAFRRTTTAIDSLQIILASAVPGAAKLAGLKMAPSVTTDTLAYIGAAGLVWVFIRLICAPYFIWRDQCGEVATLKLELTKPERLEFEAMAQHRARARLQLATAMREYHSSAYHRERDQMNKMSRAMVRWHSQLGDQEAITAAIARLHTYCVRSLQLEQNSEEWHHTIQMASGIANAGQDHLHGKITGEALALRLPPDIEEEKQP